MKNDLKDCIILIIIAVVLCGIMYLAFVNSSHTTINRTEECRFGNITLDMDSATATEHLKKRWYEMCQTTESNIPFVNNGDSIGYTYMKNCESFYIKLKSGKVNQIIFKSHHLKNEDIMIIDDDKQVYLQKKRPFKYVGQTMIFEYDGFYEYKVTKR